MENVTKNVKKIVLLKIIKKERKVKKIYQVKNNIKIFDLIKIETEFRINQVMKT